MLTDEGVTILKFFLAIDKDTQRQRFQDRVDDPTKSWKFKPGDVAERKFWDDYTAAFEEMLTETSTDFAPWYLIPSNRNWLRNLAISEILSKRVENGETFDVLRSDHAERRIHIVGTKIV